MVTRADPAQSILSAPCLRPVDPFRDLGRIADLVELCFNDTLDQDGLRYLQNMRSAAKYPGWATFASLAEEWSNAPLSGFVWEEDNRILGNLSLIPIKFNGKRHYLIANVATHPDYRRRGISRALTSAGIEYAQKHAVPSVWLQVRAENEPAINLYRSLGFEEKARRTTWVSKSIVSVTPLAEDVQIKPRPARIWDIQQAWLDENYPPELRWHLPLNPRLFHPGIGGVFYRLGSVVAVEQWSAWRKDELLGILATQEAYGRNCLVWLAASPEHAGLAAGALLKHIRIRSPHRAFAFDFPAQLAEEAILANGFYIRQTLIWMQLKFS